MMVLHGQEHVRRYQETNGEVGYEWQDGVLALVLTTTGRRSRQARTNALIFGEDGDNYVVVASKGGHPKNPDWYTNLVANPNVEVQVKDRRFHARAHTAEGAERERLWTLMTGIWPDYDSYQRRTDRQIPVVVLEPLPD